MTATLWEPVLIRLMERAGRGWVLVVALGCVDDRSVGVASLDTASMQNETAANSSVGPSMMTAGLAPQNPGAEGASGGDVPLAAPADGVMCGSGTHRCGAQCVGDLDPKNCGSSCEPCLAPAGGTATCDGTSCGGSCPEGQTACEGACVQGSYCASSCSEDYFEQGGTCHLDAIALASTFLKSCVILRDETVRCWGCCGGASGGPRVMPGLVGVKQLDLGSFHSCALLAGGSVYCWGENDQGAVTGNGMTSTESLETPQLIPGIGAIGLAVGGRFTCALLPDRRVSCWGSNSFGELGRGTTSDSEPLPALVPGLDDVQEIEASYARACARTTRGEVLCWGSDRGTGIGGPSPAVLAGLAPAVALLTGGGYVCALREDGSLRCLGTNAAGQRFNGDPDDGSMTPVELWPKLDAATNGYDFICGLRAGLVECIGANDDMELGNATVVSAQSIVPVPVQGLTNVTSIRAGDHHTCALRSNGSVWCWGRNSSDELGTGVESASGLVSRVKGW